MFCYEIHLSEVACVVFLGRVEDVLNVILNKVKDFKVCIAVDCLATR